MDGTGPAINAQVPCIRDNKHDADISKQVLIMLSYATPFRTITMAARNESKAV